MNYIAKKIALQEKNILNHADLYLDYNNRIAFHKNRKINLTVKEFDILFFLASYPGQVFTHRQIYETVWGKEYFCDEGNVTAHIGHIRKKIELDPEIPFLSKPCEDSINLRRNRTGPATYGVPVLFFICSA